MSKPPSKLLKLKKWLTLSEASRHLSGVCGEDVTEADILQFALDGYLILSVNFVNRTKARLGKVVGCEDAEWEELSPELVELIPNLPTEYKNRTVKRAISSKLDDERYLTLDDEVITIDGVWDLPLIGAERLDIEHIYQSLTGGPAITLQNLGGALVQNATGLALLQESFENNEYMLGSNANLERLAQSLNSNKFSNEQVVKLLEQSRSDRRKFVERWKSRKDYDNYLPAGGLPNDAVIVVRTGALRDFEQLLTDIEDQKVTNNSNSKANGHKERHAQNREQVLGAAFAILAKWPAECKDSKGDPVASKIANLVEAKADLFWPDSVPPLTADSIADHLRDWLKRANSRN